MRKCTLYFLLVCTLLLSGVSLSSGGGQVVILKSADIAPYNEAAEGFKKTCNCNTTELSLPETDERSLLEEIREHKPGLVLTIGLDAVHLGNRTTTLPLVYAMVPSSPASGLKAGSMSGVSLHITPEKYLNAMLDLFPGVRRVGLVFDPKTLDAFVREAEQLARRKGVELITQKVSRSGEVSAAFDSLMPRVDIIWMLPDPTVVNPESFKYLLGLSYQRRLPVFTFAKKYVELGASAGLFVPPGEAGAQAAEIAGRLMTDEKLAPLRVDARRAEILVNDRIIRKLGTVVNEDLLRRSVHVK